MTKGQRRRANARARKRAEKRAVEDHFHVRRVIAETDRAVLGGEKRPKVAPVNRRTRYNTAAMGELSIVHPTNSER